MDQNIIQVCLNIIGVLGVGLLEKRAQPYFFYGKGQTLNYKEQQALTQSILQSIAKAPDGFKPFEFPAMGYYVYTYKLNSRLTLLVLTHVLVTEKLKAALQKDIKRAITEYRLLQTQIPQTKVVATAETVEVRNLDSSSNASLEVKVTIEELVNVLNNLSRFTSNYMGAKLTANYWQSTRPKIDWLDNFQINRSAEFTFSGVITETVSTVQYQWIKEWIAAFVKRGSQIVQDLPTMIEKQGIDERSKRLLSTSPTG